MELSNEQVDSIFDDILDDLDMVHFLMDNGIDLATSELSKIDIIEELNRLL